MRTSEWLVFSSNDVAHVTIRRHDCFTAVADPWLPEHLLSPQLQDGNPLKILRGGPGVMEPEAMEFRYGECRKAAPNCPISLRVGLLYRA